MSLLSVPALELGGRHTPLAQGSLTVAEPRELLVDRACRHAFESDGMVAKDTLPFHGEALPERDVPERLRDVTPVHVHEEEVVWGGQIVAHFGHFLCESVARLWPLLPDAKLAGLPVVFTAQGGRPLQIEIPFIRDWLEAFGVNLVELPEQGKVRFTRMHVPEVSWRIGAWIAPEIRETHLHARRGLKVGPPSPRHQVLWLSRQGLSRLRMAYDEALLEWLLGEHVTPVRPEAMSLAEQVAALEGSHAVVGVIGSAFHALLMTAEPPNALYLCPAWDKASFSGQHRVVGAETNFAQALAVAAWTPRARKRGIVFPFGYRMLIPETLRTLSATVLPHLLDDPRIEAFANPQARRQDSDNPPFASDLDKASVEMLRDPLSVKARMTLGEVFEAEGLDRCALEQFTMVADLTEDNADAPLRAARILTREGLVEEAAQLAKQALAIDPELKEATGYADAGTDNSRILRLLGV